MHYDEHMKRLMTTLLPAACLSHALLALALLIATPVVEAEQKPRQNSFGNRPEQAPLYRVYTYTQPNGVPVFSDKAPADQSFEVMDFACFACDPGSKVNWHNTPLNQEAYRAQIQRASQQHGIDEALVRAVIHAESGFNPRARSKAGAIGLMQLMPATANELGVDATVPAQNIAGGVRYLAQMLEQFNGDIQLATAAYNAGPSAVDKFNAIPPYEETRTYVERVTLLFKRYREHGSG